MTDPEDLLRETLRDRADHVDHSRTPMSDVVSTAGAIRRRRRGTMAVAAAAAVAAVAVPTAFLVDHDPAASPAPSTSTPSTTPTRPSSASALTDLPTGAPPSIGYVEDHVYVASDGSRFDLPTDRGISAITPYHGGFLVADASNYEGTVGLHQVAGAGPDSSLGCTSGAPAISSDSLTTAWVTFACAQREGSVTDVVIHRGISTGMGDGETSQGISGSASLVGMIGDQVVYTGMFGEGAWVTDLVGQPREIPGLSTVSGVDGAHGLVSGQASPDDSVGVVVDAESGKVRATVDGWQLGAFSPDGRYVVATQRRFSTPPVAIFDASTGQMVSEMFGGGGGSPNPGAVAWEDNTHLLVEVNDYDHQAIVRADLDGTLTLTTGPVPSNSTSYVFAVRP